MYKNEFIVKLKSGAQGRKLSFLKLKKMLTTIILSFIILKIIYEIKSSYFGEIGQRSIAIPVEKRGVEKKEPVVVIVGAGAAGLAVRFIHLIRY